MILHTYADIMTFSIFKYCFVWFHIEMTTYLVFSSILTYKCVVFSPGGAKGRHAKTRQMVTFSCFRMATFRLATRKYATFRALRFRLLFVVSLPGGAKGRHDKTRQNHHLASCAWRPFAFSPRKHAYTTWHKSATILNKPDTPRGFCVKTNKYVKTNGNNCSKYVIRFSLNLLLGLIACILVFISKEMAFLF